MRLSGFILKLKASIFWKSVAILVSGTALAQIIGLFTTPVVSRLYDPTAFGEYAIIVSTASIIVSVVSFGLSSAVMMPANDDEADDVFMAAFLTMLVSATVLLLAMLALSPVLRFFKTELDYIAVCALVYLLAIVNNTKGLLNVYVNRKKLDRVLFYNSLIGALATLFITIPLGLLGTGGIGLAAASIAAGIISIAQMLHHANPFRRIPGIREFIGTCKKYKDFIFYQYPSNFIENLAVQLPTQVFSTVFGNANLGSYSMNEKILGIPSRLVGVPINTIYFRTAAERGKEGKNLAKFTYSLVKKILLAAFVPVAVTILWGEEIFAWVLGQKWEEAGRLAGFLVVQYVFLFCSTCTSYCRVSIGKQKINFLMSILRVIVTGSSILLGICFYGDLYTTIVFFSVGSVVFLIADMTINFWCMRKYYMHYAVFTIIYLLLIIFLWVMSDLIR